jgi:DNA methyltransferase 1-associated protein 1
MQPLITSTNTGTSNQPTFDLKTERQRRKILDLIWERTKEEELEEESLREELKLVEAQIRKLKKSGSHLLATAVAPVLSRGPSPVPPSGTDAIVGMDMNSSFEILNEQFSSSAPTPTAGIPYLQSGRLAPPATGGPLTINKTTLKRMDQILNELSVKDRPLPTNRVCDTYDHVRKGALTLLTLQKIMLKRESEVVNKRLKLEKVAGATATKAAAARAEAAAAAASAAAVAAAQKEAAGDKKSKNSSKDGGSSKAKSEGGETKKKSTKKKAAAGDKTSGETKKRKAPSKKASENKAGAADAKNTSESSPLAKKLKNDK